MVKSIMTDGILLAYWNKPNSKYYKLANKVLEYIALHIDKVIITMDNPLLRGYSFGAINGLIEKGKCDINIRYIIHDKKSIDDFVSIANNYKNEIKSYILFLNTSNEMINYLNSEIVKNNINNAILSYS